MSTLARSSFWLGIALGSAALVGGCTEPSAAPDMALGSLDLLPALTSPARPELWYWHSSYLTTDVDKRVEASMALIDRAVAAGYTGIAWYDASMTQLLRAGFDSQYQKAVVAYAAAKGLKTAIPTVGQGAAGSRVGSADDSPLGADPNWGEGPPVRGQRYTVVPGGPTGLMLSLQNSVQPQDLGSGSFAAGPLATSLPAGDTSSFYSPDDRVSVDSSGCHSAPACGHLASGGSGNERFYHHLRLLPNRQYHLSLWLKAAGIQKRGGSWSHLALYDGGYRHDLIDAALPLDTGGQWQRFDYLFNSRGNSSADLLLGIWGGIAAGDLWVDDVAIEEVGLVNVTRRANTPLRMYKATDASVMYVEGTHFQAISDPLFLGLHGNLDPFHTPPTVSILPVAGAPQAGDTVAIDYHAVIPFYETLDYAPAFACLTTPGVREFDTRVATALAGFFPLRAGFFLGYDELRVAGNCDGCRAAGTPGQVLAAHAAAMSELLAGPQGVRPAVPVYVWSDMFDKFHNAHADYYRVDGDLAGSWQGLGPQVVIFNWHPLGDAIDGEPSDLTASLRFFAGLAPEQPVPHPQIIAGYYDPALTGDPSTDGMRGCASAQASLSKAHGVPGLLGLMYTTWESDYSQLETYAACANKAWDAYLESLKAP
jgi:hypothetical protein